MLCQVGVVGDQYLRNLGHPGSLQVAVRTVKAIRWRLMLPTYEEIAGKLGVALQNVQKRLKAANWDEFSKGIGFIEKVLTLHLQRGVKANLTPERV